MSTPSKNGKEIPKFIWHKDGECQLLLEKLVKSGEALRCKPESLYKRYTIFQQASTQVFRVHLNKTRSMIGKTKGNGLPPPRNVPTSDSLGYASDGDFPGLSGSDDEGPLVPENEVEAQGDGSSSSTLTDETSLETAVGKKRKVSPSKNTTIAKVAKRPIWNICLPSVWKNPTRGDIMPILYNFIDSVIYCILLEDAVKKSS